MTAEKPSDAETPTMPPPGGSGYRTLTPADMPASKPVSGRAAPKPATQDKAAAPKPAPAKPEAPKEEPHPDPTRFGDWEVKGRCIDF